MNSISQFDSIIGKSECIEKVKHLANRVAKSPCDTILIFGKTGTGKELLAQAIHKASNVANGPFIDINCAAIPPHLMESELFGHERGSFTDAFRQKQGIIELAHNGTLFLDEISEMDLLSQVKLLKMLDNRNFRRIGGVKLIQVDTRVIVASNKNLLDYVNKQKFREDLYYRLQVVSINLPQLKERGKDVLLLTKKFIEYFNHQYQKRIKGIDPDVQNIFLRYSWPGNVRELMNLLRRIFFTEETDIISVNHLPERFIRGATDPISSLDQYFDDSHLKLPYHEKSMEYQKYMISSSLLKFDGNLARTARFLQLSRHALRHQMIKLKIIHPCK